MDKEQRNERWNKWKTRLAFLKPWDDEEDEDDEFLEIQEMEAYDDDSRAHAWGDPARWRLCGVIALVTVIIALVLGFAYYNGHHLFEEYVVTRTSGSLDIAGTVYRKLGGSIIKYSPDGVFCVNTRNESKWSAAYSMQSPVEDICGKTMVIAEQQGTQVFVLNEDGLTGNFEVSLPILKARVSEQGVVALMLDDGEVTWINLYDPSGAEIVSVRTTVADSGYPLDMALTPNASRMLVSFLGEKQGVLNSRIAFYDFSSADSSEGHQTGTLDYSGRVFPEVFYANASTPVALSDNGFVVFRNGDTPEERKSVTFEKEIVSSFHDDDYLGFVFENEAEDCRYWMELYQYGGRRVMETGFDDVYEEVKMDGGQILMYDAKNCSVYTTKGARHFSTDYEKQVAYFARLPGFRKYLVVTSDSMDQIRIS